MVSDALDQAVSAMDTSFTANNMGDHTLSVILGPVILTFGTVFRALEMQVAVTMATSLMDVV